MMRILHILTLLFTMFFLLKFSFGQVPNLGTASGFALFTVNGANNLPESDALPERGHSVAGPDDLPDNIVVNTAFALPVTLTSFTAKKTEVETAQLSWSTTEGSNSGRFEIERSAQGKVWENLAVVQPKSGSGQLSVYSYTDAAPMKGTSLYRIKMIDHDETFAYSRTRSIKFSSQLRTVMYPNPVVNELNLSMEDLGLIEHVRLVNAMGATLFEQSRKDASSISATYDMKRAPAGMYVVHITRTNGKVERIRILKE